MYIFTWCQERGNLNVKQKSTKDYQYVLSQFYHFQKTVFILILGTVKFYIRYFETKTINTLT